MIYSNITTATFISRENRFVATVDLNGAVIQVHVKNTGRCKELLVPGATVYLVRADNPKRKYQYDLVSVEKGNLLVNMDSQTPNLIFGEYLATGGLIDGISYIKPEYTYGKSRIDFYFERNGEKHLVEVKGVTLEHNGICRFPDAPTLRCTKHIRELITAKENGYQAWICFVVQMKGMEHLEPNWSTDPEFAQALAQAQQAGVKIKAFCCKVVPGQVEIDREIPVVICS